MRRTATRPALPTVLLAAFLASILTACGGGLTAGGLGVAPGAATPLPSAGAAAQGTIRALEEALATGGFALGPATRPWQPAQPPGLIGVPRSVQQVRLSDPDGGIVLVYEFVTPEAAREGAHELADYLSSGPGMINFPGDTTFHVAHLGSTVVMSWLSLLQSGDPKAAQAAFDRISTVGSEVPVLR